MIYEITDSTFNQEVADSNVPCVILFTAGWCTFCGDMVPRVENLSDKFDNTVKFCIVNSDEQRALRIAFAVAAVPYIVLIYKGMKIPLFDEIVTEKRLEERIICVLNGGETPTATPLKRL
ncbi:MULTISPECIES: co-chaperone YbbN [unclassified Adlercreutzia]|uniref:thioredoxin family protein n=1 Tax=unclassified Adlercreutzia TaxID=2636013 RepID=UPI0013EC64E2|nr:MULTISPECIES: thioredoxin domain-containing protein [unclassified Adlercreutzia]